MSEKMTVEARPEHQWLQRLVGDWTFEAECSMGPDQPPMKSRGHESVRAVGSLWVVGEGGGECPDGSQMSSLLTLGYDPAKRRFVGTWLASVMPNLWIYEGELDGHVLTLNTEGPSPMAEGKISRFRDVIELKSDDHRVLTSQMLGDDGQWRPFMTAHYRRTR